MPDPLRRRRSAGPKVKTGCITCKIRRVKCDEAKPRCQRCTTTGRKCDGYGSVNSSRQSSSSPSADEGPNLDIIRRITSISGTTQERRGFQFFLTNTAPELTGYFSPEFWEHVILQASAAKPSLKHSIIAIGSLHESFSRTRMRSLTDDGSNTTTEFAAEQYQKAIRHLRRSLATGNQEPLSALMSCILFVCFDSLRGYFASAMVHLQSGLKILRDIKGRANIDTHTIETYIKPIFLRLSIQSILYLDTRKKVERQSYAIGLMSGNDSEEDIPEVFESLEDARTSLNTAADGLFRMFYMCDGQLPMSAQPPEAFVLFSIYNKQLRQWNKAYEALLRTRSSSFTTREVRGAVLLKIHHTTCTVMADMIPDKNDTRPIFLRMNAPEKFDKFKQNFQTIVKLSRSLIAAAEADVEAGKSPLNFSTDLGLVGPIYYTCIKCQHPEVREAALELLERVPRKEGMWDGASCAKLVRVFWKMEERHKKLAAIDPTLEKTININSLVDLEVNDGLKFEWKWKGPVDEVDFLTDPIRLVGLSSVP